MPALSSPSNSPRVVKRPGPSHPITINPYPGRVRVRLAEDEQVIAETRAALRLQEAGYSPVFCIPRGDVRAGALVASTHSSYCPPPQG